MRYRNIPYVLALGAFAGCKDSAPPPPPFSVDFSNYLDVPVRVTKGGVSYVTIPAGDPASVVLPGGTTSVEWTAENFHYSDGTEVVDDLTTTSTLVATGANVELTNIVGGQTYFSPIIFNATGSEIAIGVATDNVVRCLGSQGAIGGGAEWGYYRFNATTELRYYAGTACTGAYRYWTHATIQSLIVVREGYVILGADVLP